jgi:AAA ATPase domain
MMAPLHVEVLANDWLPPVAIGRRREVAEVVRRLDPPTPRAEPPWIVGVAGPSGSGTSVVARRAAREVADRLRASSQGVSPRYLGVRVAELRGAHGVATALLRRWDDGFDGRGFPVAEILAGFLRRTRREARPVVLVLDDVHVGGPDLGPILGAIGNPDRFLPEGENGLPPFWTILAGTPDALATTHAAVARRAPFAPFVGLEPYDERTLAAIVADRAGRVVGRPVPDSLTARIVARAVEEGGGARRAIELMRREFLRGSLAGFERPFRERETYGVTVEPRVVHAIGAASGGVAALLGEVKRCEADLARAQGRRPLPTTTLWRRIVRLERAGYVRREIRTGGSGGTRSVVRVLTPIDEWVTVPHPRETLRADGPSDGATSGWGPPDLATLARPDAEPGRTDDGAD